MCGIDFFYFGLVFERKNSDSVRQQISNNLNLISCCGWLNCRYGQLCCQCVPGLKRLNQQMHMICKSFVNLH